MARIGSMCTGYGGLDHAAQHILGGELAWVADPDPGASAILAHHHPHVPNHGDIRTADWAAAEPVDVLTAGFPCQPVSSAGRHAGTADERWLFDDICTAVGRMVAPPRLLVFENVLGMLTAQHGDAMARVVQGLATLGYLGSWRTLRASDVGAPHRRERIFIVAEHPHTEQLGRQGQRPTPGQAQDKRAPDQTHRLGERPATANTERQQQQRRRIGDELVRPPSREPDEPAPGRVAGDHSAAAPDPPGDGRHQGRPEPAGIVGGPDAALSGDAPAHPDGDGCEIEQRGEPGMGARGHADRRGALAWGAYAPAIARWERVTGRPAPAPTEPGRTGTPRLSARFVEWLMGLDEGHVTDIPDLSRAAQLRALGNGVVPHQAAAAIADLLNHHPEEHHP